MSYSILVLDYDFVRTYLFDNTVFLGKYNNTAVLSRLVFHTCTNNGRFGFEKRNCLTLHVRTHQSTVSIVIFKERNHCCSNRYNLLGRNVHVVNVFSGNFEDFLSVTCGNLFIKESAVFINRLVRLCYDILILDVCCHIFDFVCYDTLALDNLTVGSFNESVFIDTRICGK